MGGGIAEAVRVRAVCRPVVEMIGGGIAETVRVRAVVLDLS